jgi:hypothetical protein
MRRPTGAGWSPFDADLPQLIDSFDKLRLLTDPTSIYVTTRSRGEPQVRRSHPAAFFAAPRHGRHGRDVDRFDTTNQVVGVSTGGTTSNLNVAKLEAGRKILLTNEVDLENEDIYVAITATEDSRCATSCR